ncbi:hypothetical protein MSAN_02239900 [Mycena sanguinolenta]|uniref:DUF6534 domain-containing protein n=1 Tax=Mycena sanguinolenta TaxID=230812 RepID=A0A8H6XBG3_9AGAR|nr:hypothetical protein MSAN_02239900 [Mycena sanguinolenta]
MSGPDSISLTLGAYMAGAMVGVGLSAIVSVQTFLYFQIFPQDTLRYKLLVAWNWLTDAGHTISLCVMIWQYVVLNFTNPKIVIEILSAFSVLSFLDSMLLIERFQVLIMFTLVASLNANVFYAWRIYKMSKHNWWLMGPICLLCIARTGMGLYIAVQLIIFKNWLALAPVKPAVVASLAVSAATDLVISAARYYYLRDLKQGYMATQEMVDAVVIFTINDGILTCAALGAAIACLLAMPDNFVWIGIYITVAKLYSNSILATLNLRNWYRHRHRPMGIRLTCPPPNRNTFQIDSRTTKMQPNVMHETPTTMEVFMEQEVEYNVPADK